MSEVCFIVIFNACLSLILSIPCVNAEDRLYLRFLASSPGLEVLELPITDKSDEIQVDVEDERFAPLYTDSEFLLDRTDPRFKNNKVSQKIDEERRKRVKQSQN